MLYRIIFHVPIFIILVCSTNLISQSIVNTEKLFSSKPVNGLTFSSELNGSAISGNASVLLLGYSLNFAYKKDNHFIRLLGGGQNIIQNQNEVSNSIFSQLRYNYLINDNNRIFTFGQIQANAILLLERRILFGGGYRTKIINLKKDSVFKFSIDLSLGLMQEIEELNRDKLPINEKYYTNYTRSIISLVALLELNQKLSIINTVYFQQYLSNLADYRLLNETNFLFKFNEKLSFSFDVEYRSDSEPPSVLFDKDLNSNIGLVFNL